MGWLIFTCGTLSILVLVELALLIGAAVGSSLLQKTNDAQKKTIGLLEKTIEVQRGTLERYESELRAVAETSRQKAELN